MPSGNSTSGESGRSMEARVGRAKQRYGPSGERLVAGIVPLSLDKTRVLLISSTRRSAWVLPKGGWETDEADEMHAAVREAWEEAGITLACGGGGSAAALAAELRDLGVIGEKRRPEQVTPEAPKASYRFFEARVEKMEEEWPEMGKRDRQWMTFKQAKAALVARPELVEALERCSMARG